MSRPVLLRSLRHRPFKYYFFGQLVSLHGTWMQNVAQAWLVYRLTHSSFMLGVVSFCALIPVLLFGLLGGLLADRLPRGKLFFAAQCIAMGQALLLAALTLSGQIRVWEIIALAFALGVVQAFEMPARHVLVAELVPREDLHNAIALNSGVFNAARFVGPTLAGFLVGWLGEGWVFFLNGVSFIGVLAALRAARILQVGAPARAGSAREHLVEGLHFAWQHRPIRIALWMLAAISLVGVPYMVLMPVFAREIFHGGAQTLGILLGASGAGALIAALRLAQRADPAGLERVIGIAGLGAGVGLVMFGLTAMFWLALPLLVLIGFALTTLVAAVNTFIQTLVPDALRGRVMAIFSVTFIGIAPLGNLLAGAFAHAAGVRLTVVCFGGVCALCGLLYWRYSAAVDRQRTDAMLNNRPTGDPAAQ
ncbi:MAG: MFS transporter [Gammaproteobacteria bacterium]